MLNQVKSEVKKNYYDPTFRGIDLEARFQAAEEKLKQATSNGQVFGIIAQALVDFNDSHTVFIPPNRPYRTDYGWEMQVIGDACYVVTVKPGSDAEAKGLRVGDVVHSVDDYALVRENLWKFRYLYYNLRPQPGMRALVQSPGDTPRQLDLMAKVEQTQVVRDLTNYVEVTRLIREQETRDRLLRPRYQEFGEQLIIMKVPSFDLTAQQVDDVMAKVKRHKALILDLRGNSGGSEIALLRFVSHLFDRDVKLGHLRRRSRTEPISSRGSGDRAFKGELVLLLDSESASASEVLARVVQIEKRGKVIGDHTAGMVMRSVYYPLKVGVDRVVLYGVTVTDADLIMTDAKSLEKVGVTPDEELLPSAVDLAARRDPVMSRAAEIVGVRIEPERAGAMFPIEWTK